MNFFKSLPARLLLALALGVALGLALPAGAMEVVVTLNYILGQLVSFCVPLIVIGFIAPSITKLGSGATRMLAVAVLLAYASSVLAALLSMGSGYLLIPHLSIASEVEGLRMLPEIAFRLDIPRESLTQWDGKGREVLPPGRMEWFLRDGGEDLLRGSFVLTAGER